FNSPRGVALDNLGRIFVADTGNHAVRRIDTNGAVTTVAGDGTAGSTDSPNARFNGLAGIAIDGVQIYVYLADTGNHRIRRLDGFNTVITLAGAERGFKDGTAAQSRFADPVGMAVDGAGHVLVAETTNSLVREIDPALAINGQPNAVFTLAGTGERGSTDGAGNVAKFNKPSGVAATTSSAVIVADTVNNTLRRILAPPVIASLNPSQGNVGASVTITGNRFDERGVSFNTVRFAAAGGTVTATVTSATRSQLNVTVPTGAITGAVTVQTAGGTSNGVTFTVGGAQPPAIADFNPKTGPVGTLVTLTGSNLKVGTTNPVITFAGPSGRLPALIAFSSATEARATVPNGAITGIIDLTTSAGTAITSLPFTVQPSQDFTITLAPSSTTVVQGSTAIFTVSITSPQTDFSQLVSLTATGLPSGAAASFNPLQITAGSTSTLSIRLAGALSPTSYSFTVNGTAQVDGNDLTRSVNGSFNVLAAGQTTLSGRVLSTEGEPIRGATVSLDGLTATTDAAGTFLLSGVTAGADRPLMVDGRTASAPNKPFPIIVEPATIVSGQANVVPYTFYLPPIDTQYEVTVAPTQNTIVTNPRLPGLSMTIPANSGIRNRDGSAVTRVSITPVPIDRTPAPLPSNLGTAMVYTSQPGGAIVNPGVNMPVVYPNLTGAEPGAAVPLYSFNHDTAQWYQYGTGHVSNDGKTINPDPGVGLPDFSWHFPAVDVSNVPWYDCLNKWMFPVQLSSGMKMEYATDIAFGGARGGLMFTRIYTNDQAVAARTSPFAFGQWTHNYDVRLSGAALQSATGESLRMALPNQSRGSLFSFSGTLPSGARAFKTIGTPGQIGDELWRNTDGTFEYRTAQGGKMVFDATGRLSSIANANGNTTTLTYTGNNLTRITDDVGRSIVLAYDANNRVQTVTDPLNRITRYTYNSNGSLTSVTDPLGNVTTYSIGQFTGRLDAITDPLGNTVKRIFYYGDGLNDGRVQSEIFADGGTVNFSYAYAGNVVTGVTVTDQLGRAQTRRFDARGLTIESTDALGQTTRIQRDLTTNFPTSVIGPCGCSEGTFTYNGLGFITTATNRLNQTIRMDYSPTLNRVERVTDELGRITTIIYDSRGNMISLTNALGQTTTFTYDGFGQLTGITDALGHQRNLEYDTRGNITAAIDPLGNRTTIEYDFIGRVTAVTDPLGRRVSLTYDDLDRVVTTTDAAGAVTTYTYDFNSNRTKVRDQLGREWRATYDSKNRLVTMTDPLNRTVRLGYNAGDEVVNITSPSGRVVRYSYDLRGQVNKVTDSLGAEIRYAYDYRGNLKTVRDERGNTTDFIYDELNRPLKVRDPLGRLSSVEYDQTGNVVRMIDHLGRRTDITYDSLNRSASVSFADATVSYTYDSAGRPTRVDDTQGGSVTWGYDNADRPISETTPAGTVSYAYNAASQVISMTAADRAPVTYGYDPTGRLQTITQGAEVFTYNYDILSRLTRLDRPNGVSTSYTYDNIDRLQRLEHRNAAGAALEDLLFAYNLDDEITSITSLASAPLIPQSKTVSAADSANRIAQFGAASYAFDVEGQTTQRADSAGATGFQWDARGRLTQATLPSGQPVSYGYDALGRRSSRTFDGATTTFLYDGDDVVLDRAGASAVDYLNGAGVDEKLRQTSSIGNLYFLPDQIGSTAALTSGSGGIVELLQYEGFGANAGSNYTRYGFTGREFDAATGLMYYRARWYDPQQGRFLSEDPIGFAGGLNLYGYVGNNPINRIDPSGEAWWVPVLIGGAFIFYNMIDARANGRCYGWRDLAWDIGWQIAGEGIGRVFVKVLSASGVGPMIGQAFSRAFGPMTRTLERAMPRVGQGMRQLEALEGAGAGAGRRGFGSEVGEGFGGGGRGGGGGGGGGGGSDPVKPYEVGRANDLRARSVRGDDLQVHHTPQSHPALQVIPGYNPDIAPSITLPTAEHLRIPNLRGPYNGTPRDLVARDIRNLRRYTDAPNNSLLELLRLIKQTYPTALRK
ncbi:MAG: RHS repeat-associated core domain-containing protein, partial [Blastocatellia bacterium]